MVNKELRIKELCKARGITQAILAKRLSWYIASPATAHISFNQALKRNQFSIDKLADIVEALNLGVDADERYTIADLFASSPFPTQNRLRCPHCGQLLNITIE